MVQLALARVTAMGASVFDDSSDIPDTPRDRSQLGIAALSGISEEFEYAVRDILGAHRQNIAGLYDLLNTDGIDQVTASLAASGYNSEHSKTVLETFAKLMQQAASYAVLPRSAEKQFYITRVGSMLLHLHKTFSGRLH